MLLTGIAVAVSRLPAAGCRLPLQFDVPAVAVQIFDWVPTGLLVIVGALNSRQNGERHRQRSK